jgi:hypothetical protein
MNTSLRTVLLSAAAAGAVAFAPVLSSVTGLGHIEVERPSQPSARAAIAEAVAAVPSLTAELPAALGPVSDGFELVGHHDLGARGMNAALAIHGDHAYVGSRTDGKGLPGAAENVNDAGILIIDISDPTDMQRVGEIGPPHQGIEGQTSREMRVWPQRDVLIVQNLGSNCSELIHACSVRKVPDTFDFYDISEPTEPVHVARYDPTNNPHEFYLWIDPEQPADRALLYVSGTSSNSFYVTDISDYEDGVFTELALTNIDSPNGGDLHSMTPDFDGRTTYLANLTGGLGVLDTSDVVDGVAEPQLEQRTSPLTAPTWEGPGAHSALRVPGRQLTIVADEVYGDLLDNPLFGEHGCPWGWVRFFDTSDQSQPTQVGEFRLPVNEQDYCDTDVPRPSSSYSAHNPTVTDELLFISWHAGGLRVISFDDPTAPVEEGAFIPEPLPVVVQEDPALTAGQDKVAFWSFPIIADGIVYVADIRNGLYALRWTGRDHEDVADIGFLEGNSNAGDAARYALLDGEG